MAPLKPWSRTAFFIILVCGGPACFGCAQGVKLAQEGEGGGIVTYPFKESGHLLSPFRKEAFQIIEQRCAGAYRIVREGEAKGRSRVSGAVEGSEEVIRERRWGIQFECK
ncbi:MAG: hypothetical protein C4293_00445 [Nitrospiraceae bacterium]